MKLVDKRVVFTREQVMQKTQSYRPIIRESRGFLPLPLRIHRRVCRQHRQKFLSRRTRLKAQFRQILRIALDAPQRGVIVPIQLGGVPPGCVGIGERFRRPRGVRFPVDRKRLRHPVLRDVRAVDLIVRSASEGFDVIRGEGDVHASNPFRCTSDRHGR